MSSEIETHPLGSEIEQFTVKSPSWPQHINERLFKCWRCGGERPWFSFPLTHHEGSFEEVLEYYMHGNPPCCSSCQYDLVYKPSIA